LYNNYDRWYAKYSTPMLKIWGKNFEGGEYPQRNPVSGIDKRVV